jgi:hypothetical protein
LVELKAIRALDKTQRASVGQRFHGLRLCLLLDFGKSRLEVRRVANRLRSCGIGVHLSSFALNLAC